MMRAFLLGTFLLGIWKGLASLKRGKIATGDTGRLSQELIERGLQYYVSARYATVAGFLPVAANLYHHAIEMLLKGSLAKNHSQAQLRYLGHNIKPLWRLFKAVVNDPTLARLDTTVAQLNKWEHLRYPDTRHGMLAAIYFGSSPPAVSRGLGGERRYHISATEIDQLVKAIFDHSGFNPKFFQSRFLNPDANEFFLIHNENPIWT